jgi:hypothetical protein
MNEDAARRNAVYVRRAQFGHAKKRNMTTSLVLRGVI